jgi:hypothetical protein
MFVSLPAIELEIHKLIRLERYNDALGGILLSVDHHYKRPEVAHNFLYYPRFDRQIQQLSDALVAAGAPNLPRALSDNTLIVASELYQVGGHSRVLADLAREVPSPTIVLTDAFSTYRNKPDDLSWILEAFEDVSLIALPQPGLWAKSRALSLLTQRLQPRSILYFNHHQDPVPFVGTLGHVGSRKTLVHHCDHNPSLGVTLAGVDHVDLTEELAQTCSKQLSFPPRILPLYVPDFGRRQFAGLENDAFSVVTSGTPNKFARAGELALQNIVHTVLDNLRGQFFHIGALAEKWVAEIRSHLELNRIDPRRFVSLGPVPSLWDALAKLDGHLYLGSAPEGGGRAAIEAQGCGYPVAFFRPNQPGPIQEVASIYANKQLGWSNLAELSALLRAFWPQQARLSEEARAYYDERYSRGQFLRAANQITGARVSS